MSESKELAVETGKIIKMVAQELVDTIGEPFAFGHAFLWVTFKVGNKSFKTLAASGALGNWGAVEVELKKACPLVTFTSVNFD